MPARPLTDAECIDALSAVSQAGSISAASKAMNINRATLDGRLREARRRGLSAAQNPPPVGQGVQEVDILRDRVRAVEALLKQRRAEDLTAETVRTQLLKLTSAPANPPRWLTPKATKPGAPGTPTLFLSDLHWGEVVDASQIGGVNAYDIEIAQRRLRAVVEHTIDLLLRHMVNPTYPGLVLALGGDMVTGDIHEELTATNAMEIMPTFVDLFDSLIWVVETLAGAFGQLFVPCVTGNHGRNTHKIRAKGRNFTSFDWLLYVMLERHFAKDKRVTFLVPSGPDVLYRVYGQRYLLTHGDQFRGGDGMIGPLGPITRGDHKKRSRNSQIGQEYDTILMGHWHQDIRLRKLIVNGSIKGYDEYAFANNFPFEPPSQALWMTHPRHGITFSMPVLAERAAAMPAQDWVGWAEGGK